MTLRPALRRLPWHPIDWTLCLTCHDGVGSSGRAPESEKPGKYTLPASQVKVQSRVLTLYGLINAFLWHRIDIKDVFEIRNKDSSEVIKKWEKQELHKAYTFKEAGGKFSDPPGEI